MKVSIVMGSLSDLEKVKPAISLLQEFQIDTEVVCYSAHRNLQQLLTFVETCHHDDTKVIIACAGMAAALPGVIASNTLLPVIGLPLTAKVLDGVDALYSMVQMPSGVPVGTVGINNAKNAAMLAIEIVALQDEDVRKQLLDYRKNMQEKAMQANESLKEMFEDVK